MPKTCPWRCPAIAAISSGVPQAVIRPPASPPSGPRSMIQSADFDHVEIVLDHQHRVAPIDQPVEHGQQLPDVVEVQAGGRLVEDVERLAGVDAGQFGGQLDPLGFAAGERGRRLARASDSPARPRCRLLSSRTMSGKFSKNSEASSIRMSSTSAIERSR